MNRQLMMLGHMGALMSLSASSSFEIDYDDELAPRKRRQPESQPLSEPMRVRKDKSASLKRLLGRKGRA